ncbi:MAG: EamA family transporter [Chloroflexi bacterium]|nr:EamA family transporter [Chloroflexota bacterium]
MQLLPFLLVLISAVTHGVWNFLAKRGRNKDVFIGLSKIGETTVFFVPFLIVFSITGFGSGDWYFFVLMAAVFVFLNYLFLSQAYKHIEFSAAYPISRSSTLFLPLLGFVFLGERLDWIGMLSVILITVAVLVIQMEAFSKDEVQKIYQQMARPGIIFALLAAFMVASYTIWDKLAVMQLQPFLYFYGYTAVTSLFYSILLAARYSKTEIHQEWQENKKSIIAVALLNTFTYLLVLVALSVSKATYVGALRQLSLVVGVFLGWKYLQESLPGPKIISVVLLITGSVLIAFAR